MIQSMIMAISNHPYIILNILNAGIYRYISLSLMGSEVFSPSTKASCPRQGPRSAPRQGSFSGSSWGTPDLTPQELSIHWISSLFAWGNDSISHESWKHNWVNNALSLLCVQRWAVLMLGEVWSSRLLLDIACYCFSLVLVVVVCCSCNWKSSGSGSSSSNSIVP